MRQQNTDMINEDLVTRADCATVIIKIIISTFFRKTTRKNKINDQKHNQIGGS